MNFVLGRVEDSLELLGKVEEVVEIDDFVFRAVAHFKYLADIFLLGCTAVVESGGEARYLFVVECATQVLLHDYMQRTSHTHRLYIAYTSHTSHKSSMCVWHMYRTYIIIHRTYIAHTSHIHHDTS